MSPFISDLGQDDADFTAEGAFVLTPIDESGEADYSSYAESAGGDVYSDYARPGAGAPAYYPPQMPSPYGYPMQQPYGMPGMPYDPYAQYGMPYGQQPYGYPMQPGYGYDPYAQQPGYGFDPYGQQGYTDPYQQQLAYQQCAMQMPPGTPQSVIDATCAMQQGAVQPWQVQEGVTDLLNQGQTAAAAALIQKMRSQPGFHEGEPTPEELARGCKRIMAAGQTIGTMCGTVTIGGKTMPQKKSDCANQLTKLKQSAQFKTAIATQPTKRTDQQKALINQFVVLMKCAGMTDEQIKAQQYVTTGAGTAKGLAIRAYGSIFKAFFKRCDPENTGKCKDRRRTPGGSHKGEFLAVQEWKKRLRNAANLPDKPVAHAAYQDVMTAVQEAVQAIGTGQNYQPALNRFYEAAKKANIYVSK